LKQIRESFDIGLEDSRVGTRHFLQNLVRGAAERRICSRELDYWSDMGLVVDELRDTI
jgi:hypothetical protein